MLRKWAVPALALSLALCGLAGAATTDSVNITVTVRYLSLTVAEDTIPLGTVMAGSDTVSAVVNVANDGNMAQDFGLRISATTPAADWTAGATKGDSGENKFALLARFVADGAAAPAAGDFAAAAPDVVPVQGAPKWCDGAVFGAGGSNVAAAGQLDLYFLFQAPTKVTGDHSAEEHSIEVEASCRAH